MTTSSIAVSIFSAVLLKGNVIELCSRLRKSRVLCQPLDVLQPAFSTQAMQRTKPASKLREETALQLCLLKVMPVRPAHVFYLFCTCLLAF